MVTMYNEKWNYNSNLNRFYNGCNYITENPQECDEYIDDVLKLKKNCELFLTKIQEKEFVTEDEILNGFDLSKGE